MIDAADRHAKCTAVAAAAAAVAIRLRLVAVRWVVVEVRHRLDRADRCLCAVDHEADRRIWADKVS